MRDMSNTVNLHVS